MTASCKARPDRPQARLLTAVSDPMGQSPACNAAALADLGLSPREIARYYGVEETRVRDLLRGDAPRAGPNAIGRSNRKQ
jgi:hypothetical protein